MLQGTGVGLRGIMFTGMGVDDATVYGCGPAGNYVHRYGSRSTGYGCGPAGYVHRYGSR